MLKLSRTRCGWETAWQLTRCMLTLIVLKSSHCPRLHPDDYFLGSQNKVVAHMFFLVELTQHILKSVLKYAPVISPESIFNLSWVAEELRKQWPQSANYDSYGSPVDSLPVLFPGS